MAVAPRCVLVDDDPDFLSFVRVCLWRICPRLEIAAFFSGVEALADIAVNRADLLLTDFKMPGLNGLELTREVRASSRSKQLPIVVMSGDDIEEAALRAGANLFLPKDDLTGLLAAVLERFGLIAKAGGVNSAPTSALVAR